ncbi:MAG TPA: hypothetical protein VL025_13900, partial [Thermoanaerobaculia bacterium]|nr:hypothetical protein [Thermoanaerobaculia bacterium]
MEITSSQDSGPGDGRIRISPSNTNPDTVEANASGAAPATIRAAGSLTRLLDVWGNDAETFPRGGTLTVRVEDPSLTSPYYGFQISTAVVQSQTTGDVESLPVYETGVGSHVFEGTIVLETGAAVPGDGKLQAQVEGEVLIAEHADENGETASSDTGRLSLSEMWFLDEDSRPTQTVLENGTLRVRLFDSFLSTPGAADVTSEVAGDGENLFFSAVPGSPGSFEGSMPTEHMTWGTPTGDGILSTRYDESSLDELDTIRAFALSTSASARAAFSELHFVDSHGNEVESFAVGETLHVRLRLNAFATPGIDQSWVLLLSPVTGDSETVTLTETGPETNVYEGSLPTGTGTAYIADGQLQVRIGEIVVAQEDRADGPFAFALDSAAITASRVTFVDQNDVPVETFLRGGEAYLEAFDRAGNTNASWIESLDVTVRAYADRDGRLVDTETVTLTETGTDTALFRGSIPMSVNSSGTEGVLDTAYYLPYEGPDRLRATRGDETDSAVLTDSILRCLDAAGNDASTYGVGDTIYLRLLRGRGNSSESLVDTLSVYLSSWTGRAGPVGSFDSVSLDLTETGPDTGVFEGQITATAGPADLGDSLFQVSPGGEIQAQFGSSWT